MDQDFVPEEEQQTEEGERLEESLETVSDSVLPTDKLLERFGMMTEEVETVDVEELAEPSEAVEQAVESAEEIIEGTEEFAEEDEVIEEAVAEAQPAEAELAEVDLPDLDTAVETGEFLPDPFDLLEEDKVADERAWFVIHCYSGYEHKVKHNLEQRIESMGMQNYIFQVVVPTVEEIEIKEGKRRTVERCLYPGYIMVQMILSDDSWYCVRNTPGVTGFVGMGNTPVPLRKEQVQGILRQMEAEAPQVRATFKYGQKVRITEGPFADFIGVVEEIDEARAKLHVLVSFFGRETPVELDFLQVEKT
jgi:transcriptional antiterminator NusG